MGTVCGVVSLGVGVCVSACACVCNKYFIIDRPRLPLLKVVGKKKIHLEKIKITPMPKMLKSLAR